jgi:N-acetylglucosaminyldiphosphoundecaprenol N-acetyl-beta-D-mannosaminyltransferase
MRSGVARFFIAALLSMENPPTIPVLRQQIAVTDYAGAVERCRAAAQGRAPFLVAAANTHVVTLARRNPEFSSALARFDLVLPDGMPLVWVMNRTLRRPLEDRVYGPTFMLRCIEATQGAAFRHFFVGGTEGLLERLCERLRERFSGVEIAGTYAPPFPPWPADENERILAAIAAADAQFVWIGLGCPRQEKWLAAHRDSLPAGVYSAVGAAFAFHAGMVRQAPAWMQRHGLEWLFRLAAEPRRLFQRYLVYNSLFLAYLVRDHGLAGRRRAG